MPIYKKTNEAISAIIGIYGLLLTVFLVSLLYFGKNIIIPIAIAILLTFLLAPLVSKIEKYIGRIASTISVVFLVFIFVSIIGYILSLEFVDLTSKLPNYKNNIAIKVDSLKGYQKTIFPQFWTGFQTVENNIHATSENKKANQIPLIKTLPVKIIEAPTLSETAQFVLTPILDFLWKVGLVMLLLFFMLLNHEDLKARIIRLIGPARMGMTTRAMSDAGDRVSHYLRMELMLNISFGLLLSIGLYFIGIPNAELWGGLLVLLRFIPYIGVWLSAVIPIVLSFIISSSWLTPLYTIGLYLSLDLVCSNIFEPLLYGASTGVSSTALLIAVVFWTLLWGPIGLLLAVPLTVCLVVIGRHVPRFEFLSILLSDERVLEVHEECYHLLLTEEPDTAMLLIDEYLKTNSIINLYDLVLIPLLNVIERDIRSESLDSETAKYLYQVIQDIIEESISSKSSSDEINSLSIIKSLEIFFIPYQTVSEKLVNNMISELIKRNVLYVETLALKFKSKKILEHAEYYKPNLILISMISPQTLSQIRQFLRDIKTKLPDTTIIIGLWQVQKINKELIDKVESLGADKVIFSIIEFINEIKEQSTNQEK